MYFLTKTIGDRHFLSMYNFYFFNLFRGIQVDFRKSFPNGQVLDFKDAFLVRATAVKNGIYLVQELGMDM